MGLNIMTFDVNQTTFPNELCKAIWLRGKNIAPLDISLSEIADQEQRDSCVQIYDLTNSALSEMYQTSELFEYSDPFFVLNRLVTLGASVTKNGEWVMPSDTISKLKKESRYRGMEAFLCSLGFAFTESGNQTVLRNSSHPLFLKTWFPFYKQCQKHGVAPTSCDFRVFGKRYKPTFDDFLRSQADRDKAFFKELHEYAIGKGAKFESKYQYRKFRYIYKDEFVLVPEENHTTIFTRVVVPYNNQYNRKRDNRNSFDLFMTVIDEQSDKERLISYIQEHIALCNACSGRKEGVKSEDERCHFEVDIYGIKRMAAVCHPEISMCLDLTDHEYDLQMLKIMIDIRIEQIEKYE